MTEAEYIQLKVQIDVLKEVQLDYAGKTIDNIIQQLEATAKEVEKTKQLESL